MSKTTLGQGQQVLNTIAQSNIQRDELQLLLESGELTEFLRKFIDVPTIEIFKAVLNYDIPLKQMIEAGNYDQVDPKITDERFLINKRESGEIEFHVFYFGYGIDNEILLAEFDKRNLRPAELSELLALGATHPNLQREFQLLALGDSEYHYPDGFINCSVLSKDDDKRELRLVWLAPGFKWSGDYFHFVAVNK